MERLKMVLMTRVKGLLLSLFICISPLAGYAQGYAIEVNARQLAGKEVILGEYFTSRMIPKDTVVLDKAGKGVIKGEKPFKGGLYILYLGPNHIVDFLMDKDQQFSVKLDTSDLLNKTEFSASPDNDLFQDYKKYLDHQRGEMNKLKAVLDASATPEDSTRTREEMNKVNKATEQYINSIIDKNKGLFVSVFLQAMKDVEIPEEILQGSKKERDSIRYFYYKKHYFDNFDPGDVRLLHTPLFEPKVKTYIEKVVPQLPDSLISACDFLIEKSRADEELFRYMLITLFNSFADNKYMGMDKVYFHLAEKYYIPFATWSSEDFITKLKENLELSKPTFIGNIAPDFTLKGIPADLVELSASDTALKEDPHIGYTFQLHDIKSKYTLLYFWEADCGHCKQATPELQEVYNRIKDLGVEVVACHVINSIEGKVLWMDFLNDHEMYDWINCWSPYNNDFRKEYNLQSFPQLFLLDENKKILAKRLTPAQAEEIINTLEKENGDK